MAMTVKEFFKKLPTRLSELIELIPNLKKLTGITPKEIDKRWILNLTSHKKVPSWSQFKQLKKFLTPQETKIIKWLFVLIAAGILSLSGEIMLTSRVLVPADGGEYIEGIIGYPNTINPLFASLNPVDADLTHLVYAGLFRYDETLNLQPDLAESYSIDKDNKTITITLKDNLKWQDGEPITQDDLLFTLNSIQNSETQSPLWVSFQGVTYNKIDDRKFSLTLSKPFAPFLNLLTVGILPEHLWQEIPAKNMRFSSLNLKPIGAGPFMFASLTKDSRGNLKTYTLKVNQNYQNKKPYLQNVTFKFLNDQASALDALHNHQIMGLNSIARDQASKINPKSFTVNPLRMPYYTALFFNQKTNQLLKNLNLRQSLNLSVNRQDIITTALKDEGLTISGPILPGQIGFTQDFKTPTDVAKAESKLDTDGWKRITREDFIEKIKQEKYTEWLNQQKVKKASEQALTAGKKVPAPSQAELDQAKKETDEFLNTVTASINEKISSRQKYFRQKNGYGLTIKITTANQPEFISAANIVKENWQDIGAQVEVEALDSEQLKDAIKNRNYEILLYGVLLGADPDPFAFWHSSQVNNPGLNLSGFVNRTADQLLEKARESYNLKERTKAYYDFQKILSNEIPAIFLFTSTYLYPMDNSVKGFNQYRIYQSSDRFDNITNWYVRTRSGWKW